MAATVLSTPRAVEMSVFVVRAFVLMREQLLSRDGLARRLEQLERKLLRHDMALQDIYREIKALRGVVNPGQRQQIGFRSES